MTDELADPPAGPNESLGPTLFPRLDAEQYRTRLLRYLYILMRLVFVVLGGLAVWWLANTLGALLFPLVASLVLAYLFDPYIDRLEQRGMSRALATVMSMVLMVVLLVVIGFFLIPPLVTQLSALIGRIPALMETIQDEWIPWLQQYFRAYLPATLEDAAERYGRQALSTLPQVFERASEWSVTAITEAGKLLVNIFNLVLIPLFTYYFLQHLGGLKKRLARLVPTRRRTFFLDALGRMDGAVGDWFRSQLKVALAIGILFSVGLSLVFWLSDIDPRLGLAIGVISGLLNIIPYIGTIVAIVLCALVGLLDWPGLAGALGVVAVFVVVNLLESYVLTPRLVGSGVGLTPIAVIILLLIGAELAGIWGVLLIIPIAGAVKAVSPDLLAIYRETAFYKGTKE